MSYIDNSLVFLIIEVHTVLHPLELATYIFILFSGSCFAFYLPGL